MRVKILVGPRAGQVAHVERSKETCRNIELGFLEELIDENKQVQVDHIHVAPPRPPKVAQWRVFRTEIGKIPTIEVFLPRGESVKFLGDIPSPAYDRWLRYV